MLITDVVKRDDKSLVHTKIIYLGGDASSIESLHPDAVPGLERLAQQPRSLLLVLRHVQVAAPQLCPDLGGGGDSGI